MLSKEDFNTYRKNWKDFISKNPDNESMNAVFENSNSSQDPNRSLDLISHWMLTSQSFKALKKLEVGTNEITRVFIAFGLRKPDSKKVELMLWAQNKNNEEVFALMVHGNKNDDFITRYRNKSLKIVYPYPPSKVEFFIEGWDRKQGKQSKDVNIKSELQYPWPNGSSTIVTTEGFEYKDNLPKPDSNDLQNFRKFLSYSNKLRFHLGKDTIDTQGEGPSLNITTEFDQASGPSTSPDNVNHSSYLEFTYFCPPACD